MSAENLRVAEFSAMIETLCSHTLVAPGKNLRRLLVINPRAGGFTIASRWKKHRAVLETYVNRARSAPLRGGGGPVVLPGGTPGCFLTGGPGDALAAVRSLLELAERSGAGQGGAEDFFLIITAGGDGTSLEVQSALYHAPAGIRERFAVVRLPMGTGNDGADAPELEGALELLTGPVDIVKSRALRLLTATAGKGPFLAFNILSVGLDAFVTHMTNRMKGKLPGDSYKLWVDIAALLYDRIYTVGPLDLRALDAEGREVQRFRRNLLLLAVGASGRRTYGSHKKILPDDRNVCALDQMSLLRKLALKELFSDGTHVDKPEARLFSASRVEFSGRYPILAQMDGETVLLRPEDFPAAIELTEPVIPLLKPRPVSAQESENIYRRQ
ncbi:MAG: diacylglycerol kinase [Treponema sp.]|jgi:diacylglycerol kinase family enzyme|nr:diacylglycerol kinase [Treponema sp.]